ncbi:MULTISPECIES: 3-hexulose-6-phosphate synthase [unclassified Virgibacillus]|uniref:3-hexulose-6-phosphate synthase n=1 Tax=unclassified Virgibacillus TaxID=2620237 RepID=UPI00090AC393|nr:MULTISPECIES: 3-hexulose-6-phosphate synthase [unclassified Virgibacillus]API91993.1 Fe-S cluster assembly protein HesB [Virgibacillus sp. 6R]MBS7430451.1 orotidine 5'-phosphate decarboxylase [Virgibacillus sp. 19R1-5]
MKLQLALDRLTKEECLQVLAHTHQMVDIIEIGTGIIKEYGMSLVRKIRDLYPHNILLIDMKTCDAGKHEAKQAFAAGADITTAMGFSSNQTIIDMLEVAKKENKQVLVDLLGINSDKRMNELQDLGVNLVGLHVGKDEQKETSFSTELFSLVKGLEFNVAVAGGINLTMVPEIKKYQPDIIIVGSAITKTENPDKTAKLFKSILQ